MNIFLNDQKLDATMEGETTLREVVDALEQWLGTSGLCITGLTVPDRDIAYGEPEGWEGLHLSRLSRLDVAVRHVDEARLENLVTVSQYLELLGDALDTQTPATSGLADGFSAMVESVRSIIGHDQGMEDDIAGLGRALVADADSAAEAGQLLQRVRGRLRQELSALRSPMSTFPRIREDLRASARQIADVAVHLQTGHDREAMETIIRFSEVSQSMLRIFSHIASQEEYQTLRIDGQTCEEFYTELNALLNDVLTAFDARDSVLIGDLFEYEIAPRVEALLRTAEGMAPEG